MRRVKKPGAPVEDRGARGAFRFNLQRSAERACRFRFGCMPTRNSSPHRRRRRTFQRHKPRPPPHRPRTGSHGRSRVRHNRFGHSRLSRRPRCDSRRHGNSPVRRDRDRAVRQFRRDARNEAEHLRVRAEVRPEHHQEEGRRPPDPGAGRRRRNQEGDQRTLAADQEEGRTARARHLARAARR
jgi:hypothetical protein